MLIGLSGAVNVLVARSRGEKNSKKTSDTVHTSAVISLIAGILVSLVCLIFAEKILIAMNTKSELLDGAVLYFLCIAGVLNVILNLIFVIVFKMGVAGVALVSRLYLLYAF